MSQVARRSRDPQYLHLYRKCISSYRTAMTDYAYARYPECVWNMYEVLEFFWKAIYFLQNGGYPHRHLPQLQDYARVSAFLGNYVQQPILGQIRGIFRRCNPCWQRNPQQRTQPRYGDEATGRPPSRLYNRRRAERAVDNSFTIARELVNIHRAIVLQQQPELLVGLLNGRFSRSHGEVRCNAGPYADGCNYASWYRCLRRIPRVRSSPRAASELDSSLCFTIDPFGESYPEKPSATNILPGYELIRDYIFFGGVFITCGGLPFTYYHDVNTGNQNNVSTVVRNYTVGARFVIRQGRPQIQFLGTTLLVNNLIQKDFNVMTTMDDPTRNLVGPIPSQIYQNTQDVQLWKCVQVGNVYNIFRPMDPLASPAAIPIVRAQIGGREVYPVSFVRYGFGLLLHIGLDLSQGRNAECHFAREAIRAFLRNPQPFFR